jgi:hypothetical protein
MKLATHKVGRGSEPRGVNDERFPRNVVFVLSDNEDEKLPASFKPNKHPSFSE